jgi:hypothetical protein
LILKGAIFVISGLQTLKWLQGKEKREQAPALQTQLSTRYSISQIKDLSRAILDFLSKVAG